MNTTPTVKYRRNRLITHRALRSAVFQRDHGVCSRCGRDCEAIRKQLRALSPEKRDLERQRLGIAAGRTSAWDIHHRIPVAAGGTDLLSNLVTLCYACHPRVSREYAAERAEARERAMEWAGSGLGEIFG
jgi:5-methylcytosine-specific restriction endonuclease McrA